MVTVSLSPVRASRLCKADEVCGSLFNAARCVRGIGIQLHDVFARDVAGVGDLYAHGDGLVRGRDLRIRRNVGGKLPIKGGVGEAVAEGIEDVAVRLLLVLLRRRRGSRSICNRG